MKRLYLSSMAEISRLPQPIADHWEWQYEGACRTMPSEMFFHPDGERGPRRRNRENAAKALDKSFIESTLRNDIEKNGVIHSWQEVIVPVLVMLGNSWAETGEGIEIEHFFSETLKRVLRERASMIQKPINPRDQKSYRRFSPF